MSAFVNFSKIVVDTVIVVCYSFLVRDSQIERGVFMALFGKATPTERKQLIEGLKAIVVGTQSATGMISVPKTFIDKLVKYEPRLIVVKEGPDALGNLFVSATDEGIVSAGGKLKPAASPAAGPALVTDNTAVEVESQFVLESGFVPPASKRGGIKANIYPFDKMAPGQSFFVAATEKRPTPAKALASTVSSATKRHAAVYPAGHEKAGQSTGKNGAKFTVRARTVADGEKADGARIYRVA
jgi:hypothetical protein